MKDSGIDIVKDIPFDWSVIRLKYLCDIQTGNQDTQDADDEGAFNFYVRSPIVERSTRYTFDGEGILMAGDGAGAGRIFHHAFGKYAVHQRVYRLANFKSINSYFLFYYLSNLFNVEMDKGSAQSTVPSVRLPMLLNFGICIKDRLRCYESADYCRYRDHKFLDFELLLSEQIYKKWILLRDELGIMHPVFLYNMAKDTSTIDAKAAFLIEMAEPLVELVKEHTIFFSCLSPGKSGTSLRMCLDSLIVTYGKDIFSRELTNRSAYDTFLDKSIKTRVRIMHIKKNAEKGYYSSKEYVLYVVKFSFLYRRIILELLGVPYEDYINALQIAVEKCDKWLTGE